MYYWIQTYSNTIDLSTRLWGINTEFVGPHAEGSNCFKLKLVFLVNNVS